MRTLKTAEVRAEYSERLHTTSDHPVTTRRRHAFDRWLNRYWFRAYAIGYVCGVAAAVIVGWLL